MRPIELGYETSMPNPTVQSLFTEAARLGIGFYLGYAELVQQAGRKQRFNTSILVNPQGEIVGQYRKIHLPGHADHQPWRPFQHLEKRYFEPGDDGFSVWNTLTANPSIMG